MKILIFLSLLTSVFSQEVKYFQRPLSNGQMINIAYRCYGDVEIAERQIWLLQGGPGGSSDALTDFNAILNIWDPLGYYCTTDYRGVALSSELRCSNLTQNDCQIIPACEQEIESRFNLSDFYTQKAAEDVISLIEHHKLINPNLTTILYGVSYGTFWLQKIMQNNGNIADKWIFDGVVLQPWFENGAWQYGSYRVNEKVFKFLFNCLENETCQKYLDEETVDKFIYLMNFELKEFKYLYSNLFYEIFSNPHNTQNHFVDAINVVNSIVYNKSFLSTRSDYCNFNSIVYNIVKANELYSDYDLDSFLFQLSFLPIDLMTPDIENSKHWINEVIRDYRPMYTEGEVLILGGEWDIQTVSENSISLHNYFLNQDVNSKVLIASNFGHGVVNFNINSNLCGLIILSRFILGFELNSTCLNHSDFKNFDNAHYLTFEKETEENLVYIINSTAAIVLGVLFAVMVVSNLIFIIIFFYRRHKMPKNNEINLTPYNEME